jgi:hypothetical protein
MLQMVSMSMVQTLGFAISDLLVISFRGEGPL